MKQIKFFIGVLLSVAFSSGNLFAQSVGDYQSASNGNWSGAGTWEVWNGSAWMPASNPPSGSEIINVDDSVTIDITLNVSGYVTLSGIGKIEIGVGSMTFNDGSTYEHARNGGAIPTATWDSSSTCLITGATSSAPGNANQDFYNFTWNCTSQSSNLNLAWSGITIGGNVTCLNSGSSRFQFSNNTAYTDSITIKGDIILQSGQLTSNGSSGAQNYLIIVEGDILVTGGNFGLSRGSGGVATWRLFGDLRVSNATIQTSNTSSKFVFANVAAVDTQEIAMSSVTYTSSWDYEIGPGALVRIVNGPDAFDLVVKKNFVNGGNITVAAGTLVEFQNGANYQHIVNSGTIPFGTWQSGSTCTITGITNQAPANRNQSFYNLIWDCPNQSGNFNMGFDDVTIGGNISIISTGASSRLYLAGPVAGDTATITVNGDILQAGGQFSSNGSGNAAFIEITVNGNVNVTNGNFSVSRGSQGGTGTTKWYLYGTNFSMTDATTQNSNAAGAKFIFSRTTQQNLTLSNVTFSGGFPVEVASNAILDVGTSEIEGSGIFTLNDGATLQTANVAGIDSTLKNTGTITLSTAANYTFNGTAAQVTGALLPATMNDLTIENTAGVTLTAGNTINGTLSVNAGDLDLNGNTITLGTTAVIAETPGNTVVGSSGLISTARLLNAPSNNNVAGLGAMLTSSADLGSTVIERMHYAAVGNSNVGIFRQYKIEPTNNAALDATLRLYYDESELNGISEAELRLFKSLSGANDTWVGMGGTVNESENYVELTGVNSLSYWTLADVNNPIPVELISFNANIVNGVVNLAWTTATELNNSGWDIERKSEVVKSDTWNKIGFVSGVGNSTEVRNYSFNDESTLTGKFSYRLKQIDLDGAISYSNLIEVLVNAPDKFELHQNFPNPFNPETVIRFDIPSSTFVELSVYNLIGEKVATLVNENLEQGVYTRNFVGNNLPSGAYIYRLTAGSLSITKKMTLIK